MGFTEFLRTVESVASAAKEIAKSAQIAVSHFSESSEKKASHACAAAVRTEEVRTRRQSETEVHELESRKLAIIEREMGSRDEDRHLTRMEQSRSRIRIDEKRRVDARRERFLDNMKSLEPSKEEEA